MGTHPIFESDFDCLTESMDTIFKYIDDNQDRFIKRLADAVAIESVSAEFERRDECHKMMDTTKKQLEDLGATCEMVPNPKGVQTFPCGRQAKFPDIILGRLGTDPNKKTLLVYGHLDVQPAKIEDGWDSEPFVLQERDGKLYGRGSTDDKGPVLAWVNAIESYQKNGVEIPVNLKFCLEGMEESGSEGLDEVVLGRTDFFGKEVDYVCISDNYWLGKTKPCLTYGLRGICYFYLTIKCAKADLHSGLFGGAVPEAMTDLFQIMSKLVDRDGKILVPGVYDTVDAVTEEERASYGPIDFDVEEYRNDIGTNKLIKSDKTELLMNRWRFPTLSLHGIEGAYADQGGKTVISRQVIGKFSLRIVPSQTPEQIEKCVTDYIMKLHAESGSANEIKVEMPNGGKPWVADINDPNFQAGRLAIKEVFGVEPDFTRGGGSIPVTLTFQEATGKNVMLLPLDMADDGAHSQNEKFNRLNYINGVKVLASYIDNVAKLSK